MTFGFAGGGGVVLAVAVASAVPPIPTLRARLEKKPSDCAAGAAFATRVGPAAGAAATAIFAPSVAPSRRLSDGAPGGLTVAGMGPGAPANSRLAKLLPSPPSAQPVLPPGTPTATILI